MARVLLLMPPLAQPLGSPYLGQLYLAAALRVAGHEVRGLDMAAVRFEGGAAAALEFVAGYNPQLVGLTLFTTGALAGYALARRLASPGRLVVAGGPHATALPDEVLAQGLDAVVVGEGEGMIVALADALDAYGAQALEKMDLVTGVHREGRRFVAAALDKLDALPFASDAVGVFDPAWYVDGGQGMPPGMVTSRGCPGTCTFCANHVTGRVFRWRSPDNILSEVRALVARQGAPHVAFWDDAFTARRDRIEALCEGILADDGLRGLTWSCITPANMVRPPTLKLMAKAGCRSINFGIESGDPGVLRAIGKGVRPERLFQTVQAAREVGMQTVVNFMFGFPDEDEAALKRTEELMERLAPHTDYFNQHGVLVPMPGTPIYLQHHERFGFTRWWLDPDQLPVPVPSPFFDPVGAMEMAKRDPVLEVDFFRYSLAIRSRIAELVRWKAAHNAATMARIVAESVAQGSASLR